MKKEKKYLEYNIEENRRMELTYIFHSGFAIETPNIIIIIDYCKDSDQKNGVVHAHLLKSQKPLYVLSTHSHFDHFNPEILKWKESKKDIIYIFSKDILEERKAKESDAIYLDKLETYEDKNIKIKAFGSTDIGGSFLIETNEKMIFHAGDLNNWHWNEESTPEEIKEAEEYFQRELDILTNEVKHLDLAMFPIDPGLGKDYMKGAQQFVDAICVDHLSPMHFSSNPSKIGAFETFANKKDCKYICWGHPGQTVIIK